MKKHFGKAFLASAALTSIVSLGETGQASQTRYYNALAECMYVAGIFGGLDPNNGQLGNSNTGSSEPVFCPILYGYNDCNLNNNSATRVNVFGYQHSAAADTVLAACRTYAAGNGGACGASSTPSGRGQIYSISLSVSAFTNDGDFAYVFADLGAKTNNSEDVLFGYWVTC